MKNISLHHILTLIVLLPVIQLSFASTDSAIGGPITTQYQTEQVSPSTYVIHGPRANPTPENQGFINNPAFIVGETGIIVIDAGSTLQVGEMVLHHIKSISDLPVVATFATHIHGDHWLGNQAIIAAYPNAVHYAHPNMIEQAKEGEGQNWVDLMLSLTEGASAGTSFIAPDTEIDEGHKLSIAGKTFAIFHDPVAHTDTDIAIQFVEERVLFLGDTAMNGRLGRLDDGNFKGLIAFLDRMLTVDTDVYVPGHGHSGTVQVVRDFRELVDAIYSTVLNEYDNGLSDFEIKPLVEKQINNKTQWIDLNESLGKFVSLAYLEVEEDAF